MEKVYCNSVEDMVDEIVDIFECSCEVKCLIDLPVAEQLSKIHHSEDFDYYSADIQSDVWLYVAEKMNGFLAIEPLYRYNPDSGRYMVESEIDETSVIAVDMEDVYAKEVAQFMDAEDVVELILDEEDEEHEEYDGNCENCLENEEEITVEEIIDYVVDAVNNNICEDCLRELLFDIMNDCYRTGISDVLDSEYSEE